MEEDGIFKEFGNRFVLFPIKYSTVWSMYKKAVSAFWTAEEIDLSKDMADWVNLNGNEQHFIKRILAFFAGSDGIVNENLATRFMNEIQVQEVKSFYGFQIAMENIHCVTGDTKILTSKGYLPIKSLEGKMVDVWNGAEWSKSVMVFKTSDQAPFVTVSLSNGMYLECTPNHEWLIDTDDAAASAAGKRVQASDLQVGQTIAPFVYPDDGFLTDDMLFSNCEEHGKLAFNNSSSGNSYNPLKFNCRPRNYVPVNASKATQSEWLNGALTNAKTDGHAVALVHDDQEMLHNMQLMLTLMGIDSKVGSNIIVMEKQERITIQHISYNEGRTTAMYCFEEPHRHTGIFNGILTGQSETYSLLLDTYVKDKAEKESLLNAIETVPMIKKKAEWSMKWITDKESSFAKRLVAFACVEGIFFSGAFCSIFWLKERGLLPGLCLSNEFISRDESLHTEFAIHLHSLLPNKLEPDVIREIVTEAVSIEDEFINESIPCNMLGMNTELMSEYIKFIADRLLIQLGSEPIYGAKNPFPFMERISLSNKSNFFEHTRQSEYAKARIGGDEKDNTFALDADF